MLRSCSSVSPVLSVVVGALGAGVDVALSEIADRLGRGGRELIADDPAGAARNPVVPKVPLRTVVARDDPDSNPDELDDPDDPSDPDGTSAEPDDPDSNPAESVGPNDDACTGIAFCKILEAISE